jgi:hypothetical protein
MCLYLFGASRNSTKKGLECINKVVNEFLVHTEEVEMERERVNEKIVANSTEILITIFDC